VITRGAVKVEWRPSLASLYAAVTFEQENAVLAIGERANANGSKAFRDLLLAEDWEAAVQLARSQTREGAHVLDVCVDYVGRDGVPDAVAIVDRYATQSTLPLVIDSTEIEIIEAALVRLGGRAVINSVNLEDGRRKVDRLLPLAAATAPRWWCWPSTRRARRGPPTARSPSPNGSRRSRSTSSGWSPTTSCSTC
jgi:5-methyltetrahydrofolate--homocysteine methyltransferase